MRASIIDSHRPLRTAQQGGRANVGAPIRGHPGQGFNQLGEAAAATKRVLPSSAFPSQCFGLLELATPAAGFGQIVENRTPDEELIAITAHPYRFLARYQRRLEIALREPEPAVWVLVVLFGVGSAPLSAVVAELAAISVRGRSSRPDGPFAACPPVPLAPGASVRRSPCRLPWINKKKGSPQPAGPVRLTHG